MNGPSYHPWACRLARRVQLRGGARRPQARRSLSTLSLRSRAPTKQMGPYRQPALEVLPVADLLDHLPGAAVTVDLLEQVVGRDEPVVVPLPGRVPLLLERPPDDLGQLRAAHPAHGRQHRAVVDLGEELTPCIGFGALAGHLEDLLLVCALGQS